MKLVSFVIPVYRNEGALPILYKQLIDEFTSQFDGELEVELLFVNDGSDDNSYNELMELRALDKKHVKVISFSRNFGQMGAVIAGWNYAKGDAVMNISADMQEPPSQFTKMIKEWQKGAEVVIGSRIQRMDSKWAKMKSGIFYNLMRKINPKMPDGGFDITLMDRKALNAMNELDERGRFYQGNILWLGFKVVFVPYTRLKREIGVSQNSAFKMIAYSLNAFLNSTYIPIRIMTFIGMVSAFAGFVYATNIVYAYFFEKVPFKGWAPIMILILFIGGLIMVMLGVIGEYIWRILEEVKKKPHYIISESYID